MANDNDVSNLSSNLAALTKQIEKNNAALLLSNKAVDDQSKDYEKILKNSQDIETSYKKQRSLLKDMASSMSEVLASTIKVGNVLGSIGTTAFAANLVKDMVDLDNKMTALSVRMGKGHEGIKGLKDSVHGLQKEFGTSYENAVGLVEELSKSKYIGNIKDAAAGIDLFSRASGVSNYSVAELTNNLSKMGGLGTDSINAMYTEMIKVQQSVGISDKGMNALVGTINEMAFNMASFGKSSDDIRRMTTQTTALVGAMEKVGISAYKSTQLVQQLTDPDRIEDNILLYSQLGVSMEDAMNGSINMESLGGQFQEMADRITQMGPIAGSSFAKSMGLSYKEVTRMAKMEAGAAKEIAEQAATPEEQALEMMKSLEKSTEGIGKRFETGLNKIEGTLKSLPTALLVGLAFVTPLIVRQGKKIFHKIFDKKEMQASVADSIVPSIENSVKKAGGIVKGQVTKFGNVISGNISQWFDSKVLKNVDAAMARYNKGSFIDKFLGASKKNAFDDVEARLIEVNAQKEKIFSSFSDLGVSAKTYKNGELKVEGDYSDPKRLEAVNALKKAYKELNSTQLALERRQSKMTPKQKAAAALEKAEADQLARKNKLKSQFKEIQDLVSKKQDTYNNLMLEASRLEKEANSLSHEGKQAALAKADALKKEAEGLQEVIDKKRENYKADFKEANEAAKGIANQKAAANGNGDRISGLGKITEGIKTRVSTAFSHTTLGKNLDARAGQGVAGGFKAVGKTAAGAAGKVGKTALKGIGKGIGGILKTMGPMALVAGIVGRLLSKIQEPLEAMLNTVVDKLSPIIESMMPAIEILVNTVATKILPPMLKILAQLLKVAHAILTPVIWILRALENVPLIGGALKGIGDTLDAATGPQVTEGLMTAADSLSNSSIKMEASSKKLDEASEKEDGPVTIRAEGGRMVASGYTEAASVNSSNNKKSSEEALKEEKRERVDNINSKNMNNISDNTSVLPKILSTLEYLLESLTNNINITSTKPGEVLLES